MHTLLFSLAVVSGIVFIGCVMLMSPKGGIGFGIGGSGGSNEYGSKKSIEFTLKRVALVSAIICVLLFLAVPYTNLTKKTSTGTGSVATGVFIPLLGTGVGTGR